MVCPDHKIRLVLPVLSFWSGPSLYPAAIVREGCRTSGPLCPSMPHVPVLIWSKMTSPGLAVWSLSALLEWWCLARLAPVCQQLPLTRTYSSCRRGWSIICQSSTRVSPYHIRPSQDSTQDQLWLNNQTISSTFAYCWLQVVLWTSFFKYLYLPPASRLIVVLGIKYYITKMWQISCPVRT